MFCDLHVSLKKEKKPSLDEFALSQATHPILGIIVIVEQSQIWRFKSFQQYFLSFIEKDRPKYWQ